MLRDSVGRNLVMSVLRKVSPLFLMSQPREDELAREGDPLLRRAPGVAGGSGRGAVGRQPAEGGARQGSARRARRLLLLDEPTRGVDVGAKGEIYARIRELAGQGLGVLIASSEMPELLGLCDRVVVLRARADGGRVSRRRR